MSDTICSFCGRERNQITVRHPIRLKDGTTVVNCVDVLYTLLKLAHKDHKWKVVDKKRVLLADGVPSMERMQITNYNICDNCWRTAVETIPQMLVKRFPMKGGW